MMDDRPDAGVRRAAGAAGVVDVEPELARRLAGRGPADGGLGAGLAG